MLPSDLPPELFRYLGPAFAPVVTGLWKAVGWPLCEWVLTIWMCIASGNAQRAMGAAALGSGMIVGIFVLVVVGVAVIFLVATILFAFLLGGLAAYVDWRRAD